MSSEQPRRARESGGSGGSPIGSPAAIIIAIIAVVGGFLILRSINDDDDGAGDTTDLPEITTGGTLTPGDTTADGGVTTIAPDGAVTTTATSAPATPTTPPAVTTGATVIVANASNVDGAAGRFTTALQGVQFTTAEPTNATAKLPVSVVYYASGDTAAQGVASYLASLLGGVAVEPMPTPPPVEGGALDTGVTVLLMLGSDKAGKTLAEAGAPTTTTIPAAGATTSVAPTST